MEGWNNIESAPRDGTILLLHNLKEWQRPIRGYWNGEWLAEVRPLTLGRGEVPDPTHWLPVTAGGTPMTVSELIEVLKRHDPSALVMIECDDPFYDGPLTPMKISSGTAGLVRPFEWKTPPEDDRGRPVTPKTMKHPGGWFVLEKEHTENMAYGQRVIEKRKCFIVRAE